MKQSRVQVLNDMYSSDTDDKQSTRPFSLYLHFSGHNFKDALQETSKVSLGLVIEVELVLIHDKAGFAYIVFFRSCFSRLRMTCISIS